MLSFLMYCVISAIAWHILDNYTSVPTFWKGVLVFILLICLPF